MDEQVWDQKQRVPVVCSADCMIASSGQRRRRWPLHTLSPVRPRESLSVCAIVETTKRAQSRRQILRWRDLWLVARSTSYALEKDQRARRTIWRPRCRHRDGVRWTNAYCASVSCARRELGNRSRSQRTSELRATDGRSPLRVALEKCQCAIPGLLGGRVAAIGTALVGEHGLRVSPTSPARCDLGNQVSPAANP